MSMSHPARSSHPTSGRRARRSASRQLAAAAAACPPAAAASTAAAATAAADNTPRAVACASSSVALPSPSLAVGVVVPPRLLRPSKSRRVLSSPEPNVVRVSDKHRASYFVDIGLRLLQSHEVISVVGIGGSIYLSLEVSQRLRDRLGDGGVIAQVATTSIGGDGGGTPKPAFRMDIRRTNAFVLTAPGDSSSSAAAVGESGGEWSAAERRIADFAEHDRPPIQQHTDEQEEEDETQY